MKVENKTGGLNICSGKSSETTAEKGLAVPITTLFRDKQWTQKYVHKPFTDFEISGNVFVTSYFEGHSQD